MMNKCEVEGKFVNPCDDLKRVVEGTYVEVHKGIGCYNGVNLDGEPSRRFYAIKSGEEQNGGLAINFCPFCGVDHRQALK